RIAAKSGSALADEQREQPREQGILQPVDREIRLGAGFARELGLVRLEQRPLEVGLGHRRFEVHRPANRTKGTCDACYAALPRDAALAITGTRVAAVMSPRRT